MPNGGPDCCGNCSHNYAVQKMPNPKSVQMPVFEKFSTCMLRKAIVSEPYSTFCRNFHHYKTKDTQEIHEKIDGPIFSNGVFEGYVRIPWINRTKPQVSVPVISCETCGRRVNNGVKIKYRDKLFGFCTNYHYVEWWKSIFNDKSIVLNDFSPPEIFLKH